MQAEKLKEALTTDPFVPFIIRFGSRRSIEVANPGLVAISSNGRSAYVFQPKGEGGAIVDVMLIEAIEFVAGNGKKRRRAG